MFTTLTIPLFWPRPPRSQFDLDPSLASVTADPSLGLHSCDPSLITIAAINFVLVPSGGALIIQNAAAVPIAIAKRRQEPTAVPLNVRGPDTRNTAVHKQPPMYSHINRQAVPARCEHRLSPDDVLPDCCKVASGNCSARRA